MYIHMLICTHMHTQTHTHTHTHTIGLTCGLVIVDTVECKCLLVEVNKLDFIR